MLEMALEPAYGVSSPSIMAVLAHRGSLEIHLSVNSAIPMTWAIRESALLRLMELKKFFLINLYLKVHCHFMALWGFCTFSTFLG